MMESYKVVRPEHLNHYGYLFGGFLLKWVDEISWIAASRDHPGCHFVTVAMDQVVFRKSVREGTVLRFQAGESKRGRTSTQYLVEVFADDLETGAEDAIFTTHVSFVCLDGRGGKIEIDSASPSRPTG
jgi:acyl-CoA hydrolase